MKSKILNAVAAASVLAASSMCFWASADAATQDGQYFCVTEHVAGIKNGDKEKNEPTVSGKLSIPEGNVRFFIKISPITRDEIERKVCEETVNYYMTEFLQKGIPYDNKWNLKFYNRNNIGFSCFTSSELKLTYTGDSKQVWPYRGYDGFRYYGFSPSNWIEFYADNSFAMGFPYDSGPVVEYGHCTKIELPK